MGEFGMIRSFGIDNDELAGLRPQEVFVLGYELAQVDALIDHGEDFTKLIHSANKDRISKKLVKDGRQGDFIWSPGDISEDWLTLRVYKKEVANG